MYQRSATLVPLVRTCCRSAGQPVAVPSRNVWDLVRGPDPRGLIRDINREMDRMERNLFRNFPFSFAFPRLIPIAGSEEAAANAAAKSFRVNIDVEGYKPEDIKISLKDNVMRIEAKMDHSSEDGSRLQQSFVREFTVPENVDLSTMKSFLHNDGRLCIEAGLTKESAPKDIPIEMVNSGETPKSKM